MTTQGVDKIIGVSGTIERHTAGYGNTIIFHPDMGDEMGVYVDANVVGPRDVANIYWAGILGTRCHIEVKEPEEKRKQSYIQWEMASIEFRDRSSNYAEKVSKLKEPFKVIDDLKGLMNFRVLVPVSGVLSETHRNLVYAREIIHWTDNSVTIIEYDRCSHSGALTHPRLLPPLENLCDLGPTGDLLETGSLYDYRTVQAFERHAVLTQIGHSYVKLRESFPESPSYERNNPFLDVISPAATIAHSIRNRLSEALYKKQ